MKNPCRYLPDTSSSDEEFQMSPLIDCVFLLLVFFMTSATLMRVEADLGFSLPATIPSATSVAMPDEQMIEIAADGAVSLNGVVYGLPGDAGGRPPLMALLTRFRQASEAARNLAMVTIVADESTPHERVVAVLDTCAGANIKNITFGL
jgi:biopolymer transport protein ExbD